MAGRRVKPLRVITDPFVVAPPSGTHIRTVIPVTPREDSELRAMGSLMGGLFRSDLAHLLNVGGKVPITKIDKKTGETRTVMDYDRARRKREMTAITSARWASAITRTAQDQYELGMRNLAAEKEYLETATGTLRSRLSKPVRSWSFPIKGERKKLCGYRDEQEWFQKRRRCEHLEQRLVEVVERSESKHPRIVIGSRRLLKRRNNLRAPDMTGWQHKNAVDHWDSEWDASRMLIVADGQSGAIGGNQMIRLSTDGILTIKRPGRLMEPGMDAHLTITTPVRFPDWDKSMEWHDRVLERRAIRYDIIYDPEKDKWYLDASWGSPVTGDIPAPETLKTVRQLAVDLNADHLAVCVVDQYGNPVGSPKDIEFELTGSTTTRDGRLRAAITDLIRMAEANDCQVITIEDLNFQDARNTGRETMGRGRKGKKFRKTVAGIPTAKFRDRLVSMAYHAGIWILAVDPAYTSKWGEKYWRVILQKQTSIKVTRHHCAALAIGRRGHGYRIGRRKTGPRGKQRIAMGLPYIAGPALVIMPPCGTDPPLNNQSIHKTLVKMVKRQDVPVVKLKTVRSGNG